MIDTIKLLIPKNEMLYIQGISSWDLYSKTEYYAKYIRNPSKTEKETGRYFPRLTGYKRGIYNKNVVIEFSAPKLLYKNNLDELAQEDFPRVVEKLQDRLKDMGVIVEKTILEKASVSSVHFSKNVLLRGGYTANHLISEINKVNLTKNFDFAKTRFINDGQSIYAHATSHQLVIYDKIADLAKGKKRAIDKNQTSYQRSLFNKLNNKKDPQEIIRFEIRLSHKQKMNKLLEDLGYHKNPVFKEIFNTEVSKKVVTNYWEKLIKNRCLGLFSISVSIKDMLQILFLADKTLKPKQAIYLIGLFVLTKDENGIRQLRTIVSKRSHDRTWYRTVEDMQRASELITKNKLQDWVTQIDKAFEDYKPYKIKDYENKEN
jgi:hypothetical protein